MNEAVSQAVLDSLHTRICRVFPAQIRACLEALSDEQIWWRPNEKSNSVGNLVIHLSGSLNHYLNRQVGGIPYERDRAAEFAERRHIPKVELLAIFDDMVAKAEQTFAGITLARLEEPSPEQRMQDYIVQDLLNIAIHVSTHAGQIAWITKMLQEGSLDDLWINTHRSEGAWKSGSGRSPSPR
jgi:hypothetical protein